MTPDATSASLRGGVPTQEIPSTMITPLMLDVYASVLDGGAAAYCSTPITSGRRFIAWLEGIGKSFADVDAAGSAYHEQHLKEVIEPNRLHAQRVIRKLREASGRVIIDPTAVPYIEGWTQVDWRTFWRRVIERYAHTAYFVDDWCYSNGCAYEFWVAHRKGIPTLDEHQQPLSREQGISLICKAADEMDQLGASTTFLREVQRDLERLPAQRGAICDVEGS